MKRCGFKKLFKEIRAPFSQGEVYYEEIIILTIICKLNLLVQYQSEIVTKKV